MYDDDDPDDRELVRVPKGGRRRRYYDDDSDEYEYDDKAARERSYFDSETSDYDYDEEDDGYADEEEPIDEARLEQDLSRLLADEIIPNPLLDSMDPDGAADRFPELARDPRFWFELFLFIMAMDFLSAVGPRSYMTDMLNDAMF